jgi:type IV secretory pathway ATPase VirB11/archaellum biosynthesis ATPase
LPPVVAAPAFAIRKPAVAVFTLDDYVAAGIMSADQAEIAARSPSPTAPTSSSPAAPRPARPR